jgi:hypothetical protein
MLQYAAVAMKISCGLERLHAASAAEKNTTATSVMIILTACEDRRVKRRDVGIMAIMKLDVMIIIFARMPMRTFEK